MSKPRTTFWDINKDQPVHEKTIYNLYGSSALDSLPAHIQVGKEEGGKHRYLMFLGSKVERKNMMKKLTYDVLPYPKGENKRYDASHEAVTTDTLF